MSDKHKQEQEEDRSVIRQQNRALRSITRKLRAEVRRLQEKADETFRTICETQTEAEKAFGELWGSANFDCGPEDYEFMVKETISAFERLKKLEAANAPRRVVQVQKRKFSDS